MNKYLEFIIKIPALFSKERKEKELTQEKITVENETSPSLLKAFEILSSSLDLKQIVNNVITAATLYLKFDKIIIFLYGQETKEIIYSCSHGLDQELNELAKTLFKKNGVRGTPGTETVIINDLNRNSLLSEDFARVLNIQNAAMSPVKISGNLEALIIGGYKDDHPVSAFDVSFLNGLSNGAGTAMKNAVIFMELQQLLTNTVTSFALLIDAKSQWTRGHTERVTNYAISIGAKMGLNGNEMENLWLGGLLHDIGKIGTSDTILDKSDKLTNEEFEIIRKHPVQGSSILASIKQFKDITSIIRHHHERYDGKGYPDGLKGKDIPLLARILCVADAYDAMTAKKPYRKELSKETAKEELKKCSGTQFDPQVVEVFLQVI